MGALEQSQSIGGQSGWIPVHFREGDALLPLFEKSHSYGEYIFDWEWAAACQRHGIPYFPKLVSMIPFTPATFSHFIRSDSRQRERLFGGYRSLIEEKPYSSSHFLFIEPGEEAFFLSKQFLIRHSFQYHFFNEGYSDFSHFLSGLKSRKARQILRERALEDGVEIERCTGETLKSFHGDEMYEFYRRTTDEKCAIPYLNREFFRLIFERLKDQVLYVRAFRQGEAVAGALFFFGNKRLYGRYWGCRESIKNLHFELCYYQGIEFCIENGFEVFEAGAQGEHKVSRGFRPTLTRSAHWIRHPGLREAVACFVEEEKGHISHFMGEMEKHLPFLARSLD